VQIDHEDHVINVTRAEAELLAITLVATNSGCGDLIEALGDTPNQGWALALTSMEYPIVCELQRYLPELF
jgi:hypothetical protein